MRLIRRPLVPMYGDESPVHRLTPGHHPGTRPGSGGAAAVTRLPVAAADGQPFAGMDPSNPVTWVRPWNPQPGMIAYLNFDGAKQQAYTPTGTTGRPMPQSNVAQRRKSLRTGRG
jgi:hypothetical protein